MWHVYVVILSNKKNTFAVHGKDVLRQQGHIIPLVSSIFFVGYVFCTGKCFVKVEDGVSGDNSYTTEVAGEVFCGEVDKHHNQVYV